MHVVAALELGQDRPRALEVAALKALDRDDHQRPGLAALGEAGLVEHRSGAVEVVQQRAQGHDLFALVVVAARGPGFVEALGERELAVGERLGPGAAQDRVAVIDRKHLGQLAPVREADGRERAGALVAGHRVRVRVGLLEQALGSGREPAEATEHRDRSGLARERDLVPLGLVLQLEPDDRDPQQTSGEMLALALVHRATMPRPSRDDQGSGRLIVRARSPRWARDLGRDHDDRVHTRRAAGHDGRPLASPRAGIHEPRDRARGGAANATSGRSPA